MNSGYPRWQRETSILADWLHSQKDTLRNPSGHRRRKQNKYLQLSSSLFGDQDERDRIREERDVINKTIIDRQIEEDKLKLREQKDEDEKMFALMGIDRQKRESPTYPKSGPQINQEGYEPSFSDKETKRKRGPASSHHPKEELERRHSLDSSIRPQFPQERLGPVTQGGQPSNLPPSKVPPQFYPPLGFYPHPGYHPGSYPELFPQGQYPPAYGHPQGPHNQLYLPPGVGWHPHYSRGGSHSSLPHSHRESAPRSVQQPSSHVYYPSERELEEERQKFLLEQVESQKQRDYDQRRKELEDELLLEQNLLKQREKLRLEYEAELAKAQAKEQRASKRQEEHHKKIARLNQESEEAKKAKMASKIRGPRGQKSTVPRSVPQIVVDSFDDLPIKPTKKQDYSNDSRASGKKSPKPKKTRTKKQTKEKETRFPRTSEVASTSSSGSSRKSSRHQTPQTGGYLPLTGKRTDLRYVPEDPEVVNMQERDGKRRRLPAKRIYDDFGLVTTIPRSRPLVVVDDDTFTSTLYDWDTHQRPHKKKVPFPLGLGGARVSSSRTGTWRTPPPGSEPLPPITTSRPTSREKARPSTNPPVFSRDESDDETRDDSSPSRKREQRPCLVSAGVQVEDDLIGPGRSPPVPGFDSIEIPDNGVPEPEDTEYIQLKDDEEPWVRLPDIPPTPAKPSDPPPPFEWKIELEENKETEEQTTKNEKKIKKFKKNNVGLLSQLSALKSELMERSGDDVVENDDDNDDIGDTDEDESMQNEKEEVDKRGKSNEEILNDEFSRKVSLGDTQNLDLESTNKTMLRKFMERFSRREVDNPSSHKD